MSKVTDYISRFFKNQEKRQIIPDLKPDTATRLAQLGVDKAIYFLLSQDYKRFIEARNRALTFRPRYRDISEGDANNIANTIAAMKTIHPSITKLPFKYFLNPIGIGHFSELYNKLDRSTSIQTVIDYLNSNTALPSIMNVRRFEEQAIASLIFHSEIASAYENPFLEHDVNPSAIDTDAAFERIVDRTLGDPELGQRALKLFDTNDNLKLALSRLSQKVQIRTKRWKPDTYDKIYFLAADLPRRLQLADQRIDLLSDQYPRAAFKLSIFTLTDLTHSAFIAKKYAILHDAGLRHIGDLVLFKTSLRKILFS